MPLNRSFDKLRMTEGSPSRRPGNEAGQAHRRDAGFGKRVVTQNDREVDLGLGRGHDRRPSAIGKGQVIEDLHRINARRDVQDMRPALFRQASVAEHVVRPVVGTIQKPVMAGKTEPSIGPHPAGGRGVAVWRGDMVGGVVVLRHDEVNMELLAGSAPRDGGKRLHLTVQMRHHVEVVSLLADKGGIRFHIDEGEIFVAGMGQRHFLPDLQRMGDVRRHPLP